MSMFRPSQRGATSPSSPIRRLAVLADEAAKRGVTVHHLNIGQPDIKTPQCMLDAYRNYDESVIEYAPSDGYLQFRDQLANYYQNLLVKSPIKTDDIVVTTGGSEALLFTFAAICDPDDEILVCEPFYTNYAGFAHLLSIKTKPVTTCAEDGYRIDINQVRDAITERTRAITIPSPGNPTGLVLTQDELQALVDLCREHNLFYISDEVYRDFVYNLPEGVRAPSSLSCHGDLEHVVVIDSVSKRYSACGSRIGWLATTNKAIRDAALCYGQARLSPATVDQYASMAALQTPESYFTEARREYMKRRDLLVEGLVRIGIKCTKPDGAFYLAAQLPVSDAEDFCRFLLNEHSLDGETVMLAPLAGFYATEGMGMNEVRIAYVLESSKLKRCIDILESALAAYKVKTQN